MLHKTFARSSCAHGLRKSRRRLLSFAKKIVPNLVLIFYFLIWRREDKSIVRNEIDNPRK